MSATRPFPRSTENLCIGIILTRTRRVTFCLEYYAKNLAAEPSTEPESLACRAIALPLSYPGPDLLYVSATFKPVDVVGLRSYGSHHQCTVNATIFTLNCIDDIFIRYNLSIISWCDGKQIHTIVDVSNNRVLISPQSIILNNNSY